MLTANYVKVTNGMFVDFYVVIVSFETSNHTGLIKDSFYCGSDVEVLESETIYNVELGTLLNAFGWDVGVYNIKFISE